MGGCRSQTSFSIGWSRFVLHLILRCLFSQTTCWCHLCWVRMKREVASCWSLGQKTRKAARWMWKYTKPHRTAAPAHVPLHLRRRLGIQNKAETNRKQNSTHKDNEINTDKQGGFTVLFVSLPEMVVAPFSLCGLEICLFSPWLKEKENPIFKRSKNHVLVKKSTLRGGHCF